MRPLIWRLVGAGVLAAVTAGVTGRMLESARFGATDEEAMARVEAELRQRFDAAAEALGAVAVRIAGDRPLIRAAGREPGSAARLFDTLNAALDDEQTGRTGITVYNGPGTTPIAWAGRTSDLPKERINGLSTLFVAPGALGPRLVRIEPVTDRTRRGGPREGTVVVEQSLAGVQRTPAVGDTFVVSSTLAPVSIRTGFTADHEPIDETRYTFSIPSASGGGLLVEAEVARGDVAASRALWRSRTRASVVAMLALTLLLCCGPILDTRRRTRSTGVFVTASAGLAALLLSALAMSWLAVDWSAGDERLQLQFQVLLAALAAVGTVAVALTAIERRRLTRPRPPLIARDDGIGPGARLIAAYVAAGAIGAGLLAGYERLLQRVVSATALDVLHFSLHPVDVPRLAVAFGLILLHAAAIWAGVSVARVAGLVGRVPRRWTGGLVVTAAWLAGGAIGAAAAARLAPDVRIATVLVGLGATGACAAVMARALTRSRHASQAARIAGLFLALLVPAIAMYPSLVGFATEANEQLIADEYGPLALSQRDDLKNRLRQTLDQIDAIRSLGSFIADSDAEAASTDPAAFAIWSKTDLQQHRIMSAVELYRSDGRRVSRFALNLPEYTSPPRHAASCEWDLVDEPSPIGSSVRHVLSASRAICEPGAPRGAIVVRVMLDYTSLPFIASQSPYLAQLRPEQQPPPEGAPGRDVEFAVYGWSRAPIYASGVSVWPLPDDVFERTVQSRAPFWSALARDERQFRVHLLNDRGGIYALGYPVLTGFDHLVNLAELVVLAGVLYAFLLGGAAMFRAVAARTPVSGRALFREMRSSFYWRVFLASLAGAILPVVILAVATRTYFARQLEDGVDEAAAKTATVAQRLVEDYASLQQRGADALSSIDDPIMMLVGRAIDQDVNLYDRTQLQATSEGDLFASELLSRRTPGLVYQRIILERLPTFVNAERVGDFSYLVAAAPVRAGGREGIVTVPLPLRQQEIERQIDELDRQVMFAAVLFSLLGAAIGYWMAERIADPVSRLTHATRRIASGDLDARIAAESADELGRLVRDFNRMADDLKRQRTELERTQRLEAWADMARQVAHDIKNPLTPIRLSAEHARRINIDRGRPLSPVLDHCVDAILNQVALLRQISSEFSNFASSPTARPEPTAIADVVEETIAPYREGLTGRIAIEVDIEAGLPRAFIDRTLFARAMTNIIDNALHAMPGPGTLTIRGRRGVASGDDADARRETVQVDLSDTGVGMDPDAMKHMFEPYFSTKATGTGLGLSIAKRNIELNGGTIEVRSQRGAGTTVTIAVPVSAGTEIRDP